MYHSNCAKGAAITAFFMAATPAFAEFNPTIALDRYLGIMESAGLNVAIGEKTTDGETVRWSDIVITDDKARSTTNIDWLEAMPAGRDTVRVLGGNDITVVTDILDEDEDVTTRVTTENYEMIVGEDGDIVTFSLSADRITALTEGDGRDLPLTMSFSIETVGGTYAMTREERVDGEISTGPVSVSYSGNDGESEMSGVYAFDGADVSFGADITDPENFEEYLSGDKGFSLSYNFPNGVVSMDIAGEEIGGSISSTIAQNSGEISFEDREFRMAATASDIAYVGNMPQLGLPPVEVKMESVVADISFPFADVGETSAAKFKYALNEVTVSDVLWSMFDPNATIERAPATLRIDVDAVLMWMTEFVAARDTGQPPFLPQEVNLNELLLSFGGASVEANGSGTLSMQTMVPESNIHVEARNVLMLVDALSALGIVPPMQAMMVKGMLPEFTTQGPDGPDHLIADIVSGADGSISINGNRIK